MKYQSITTPSIEHDAANSITELILLNKDISPPTFPWRGTYKTFWTKTVPVIRKLMRDFNLSEDQLAFYVYRCQPESIDGKEFGKIAVVAKKLFQKYDLQTVVSMYNMKYNNIAAGLIDKVAFNNNIPPQSSVARKPLLDFIRELENGSKEEN